MTNDEIANVIMTLVQTGSVSWTTAPAPSEPPPPGATLEGYVGNAPRLAILTTHITENTRDFYSAMATITSGNGIVFIHLNEDQAKTCFEAGKSRSN